jgi:hypothetical protein
MKQYMNKSNLVLAALALLSAPILAFTFQGCSGGLSQGNSVTASSTTPAGGGGGGTTPPSNPVVAGAGSTTAGKGAVTCPTAGGIVQKVESALGVSITGKTNTATAYTALFSNLPQTSDCTKAVGYDNAQLFIYAACSDLAAQTAPLGVTITGSITTQQTNLINAGLKIVDNYTGGLGSGSTATSGITTALTNLVTGVGATAAPATTKVAFMDVCIAASTAGALLITN